eukprot:NODE_10_length_61504_cov_0.956502.p3 type:complete len:680 gc:universal NODE_10_length_61504_cov_0.956502:30763-32802(+)
MIVFSSDVCQLSFLQNIHAPVATALDLVDSTILISAEDGIYYGVYNNIKKLTLNKKTCCLLKSGGDLITVYPDYISSINQKIICNFQPSKVLPNKQFCLFYNPNGYFCHLNGNELKNNLLPYTILKKPINCAGYIVYNSAIKTLLVTGHTIYQFTNGANEFDLQTTLNSGIFGIVDGYSSWMCMTIEDQKYCIVELSPIDLKVIQKIPLHVSDKAVFLKCYIIKEILFVVFSTYIKTYNLNGDLIDHLPFPNQLKVVSTSPMPDRDNKLRFVLATVDEEKKINHPQIFSLEVKKSSFMKPFKDSLAVFNYLLYGWVQLTEFHVPREESMDEFLKYICEITLGSNPLNLIEFQIDILERIRLLYAEVHTDCPIGVFNLLIYKKLGHFLIHSDLSSLFLQQTCTKGEYKSLGLNFSNGVTDFNFYKGISEYLNSTMEDKLYAINILASFLNILGESLNIQTAQFPDCIIGVHITNCIQKALSVSEQFEFDQICQFLGICAKFILKVLSPSSRDISAARSKAFLDCFEAVVNFYFNYNLDTLIELLSKFPSPKCVESTIFYNSSPEMSICNELLGLIDSNVIFDAFTNRQSGELLCNFTGKHFQFALSYAERNELPEILFLLYVKLKKYDLAYYYIIAALEKYENQHGLDFCRLRITSPKNVDFSISPTFDYLVLIIYLVSR